MNENYTPLSYKFDQREYAEELLNFLNYSGFEDLKCELDEEATFYQILIPREMHANAEKLANAFHLEKETQQKDEEISHKDVGTFDFYPEKSGKSYLSSEEQYSEMKSSASSFLVIGIGGLILDILILAGVIPFPFATNLYFTGTIMAILFLIFICIGIFSHKSAAAAKEKMQKEKTLEEELLTWFYEHNTAAAIDETLQITDSMKEEELYFKRASSIKDILTKQSDQMDEVLMDKFVEDIYTRLYDQ